MTSRRINYLTMTALACSSMLWAQAVAACVFGSQAFALLSLKQEVDGAVLRITIEANAPPVYAILRPSDRLMVIDFPGGDGTRLPFQYAIKSTFVESIGVRKAIDSSKGQTSSDRATFHSATRIEIRVKGEVRDRSVLEGNTLIVELWPAESDLAADAAEAEDEPAPNTKGTATPDKSKTDSHPTADPAPAKPAPGGDSKVAAAGVTTKSALSASKDATPKGTPPQPAASVGQSSSRVDGRAPNQSGQTNQTGGKPASVVQSVRTESTSRGVRIRIETDGLARYKEFMLGNPSRIVVDIEGVRSALVGKIILVGAAGIERVRVGQPAAGTIRIVLDSKGSVPFRVVREGSFLIIVVEDNRQPKSSSGSAVRNTIEAAPSKPPVAPAASAQGDGRDRVAAAFREEHQPPALIQGPAPSNRAAKDAPGVPSPTSVSGPRINEQDVQFTLTGRIGIDGSAQKSITLGDAVRMALENDKDITAAKIDVEMAGFDLRAAKGGYDPKLFAQNYYETRDLPSASSLSGGTNGKITETDFTGTARIEGATPWLGGKYQIDFITGRTTSNNLFAILNPQFASALTFSYTQPLWRGLLIDDNRRRIQVAKKNLALSDEQFRQRAIEVVSRVEQGYWDLVFSLRDLQVQIEAVKQARAQVESNKRQVAQGTLAPIDIVAAQTQMATFEQNVYRAQEVVTRAENSLKLLILPGRKEPLWSSALLPASSVELEPPRITLEQAVGTALQNRSEIAQVKTNAEINEIQTRYYRDQTKPDVSLVGIYTARGLAGTVVDQTANPFTGGQLALIDRLNVLSQLAGLPPLPPVSLSGVVPSFLIGGDARSLSALFGNTFPTVRFGLSLSLPLGNRTAEANLGRTLAEGRKIRNLREQVEQQIEAEVRNTMQAIRSVEARLSAAVTARSSSQQQYESERRRFEAGLSTVFLVLQRQTDLISAQGRELQAQTDLNKAIADFKRATGLTLEANNVTLRTDGAASGQNTGSGAMRQSKTNLGNSAGK